MNARPCPSGANGFALVRCLVLCIALSLSVFAPFAAAQQTSDATKVDPTAAANYTALSNGVQAAQLQQTIADLSSIQYTIPASGNGPAVTAHSRLAGTRGGDEAAAYVQGQFNTIFGPSAVTKEPFNVTVPVDRGASVAANGHTYALQPLWPNLVRTSTLPAKGIDGPLIYAGNGDLRAFRGKPVDGSIVLLDFNCGTQWLNASRLGAKAIIFVAPTQTMRGEAEAKFVGIPVAIPRFFVNRADAAALESAALTTPNFSVHLMCDNPWLDAQSYNFVGKIAGTDPVLSKQVVIIESYYDSMSIVPTQAPGADTTCGFASMLEIARAFKAHPPKRSVWFVASGAHYLGILGARTYIDKHLEQWQEPSGWDRFQRWIAHKPLPKRDQVLLFSGLDLTSQTGTVGVFYKGDFYDYREDIQGDFSDIGHALSTAAGKIGQTIGFDANATFADGINPTGGKGWRNYLPGQFAFDAEAATMAGGKGITFATTNDARQLSDTPKDTLDTVNVANLVRQTRLLTCEYWDLLNDPNDPNAVPTGSPQGIMPIQQWPAWTRQGLRLGFSELDGRALVFDPRKNFVPDEPIVNSLAVIANPSKTMVGVRGNLIQGTFTPAGSKKPDSEFRFIGLPLVISNSNGFKYIDGIHLAAYHIHETDDLKGSRGDIDYAPDQGIDGSQRYPIAFQLNGSSKTTEVIMFSCVATSIYDLIDQQSLKSLTGVRILDGVTEGDPRQYGFVLAGTEPGVSYVEDVAVLFSTPGPNTRLKVIMDSGPAATRFLLINSIPWSTEEKKKPADRLCASAAQCAQGVGYAVGARSALFGQATAPPDPSDPNQAVRNGAINNTALRVAEDMWNLDDYRIRKLAKYRIVNDVLSNKEGTGLHDIAHEYIQKALVAYKARDYDTFDSLSRQAWAYESRVYPQAQGTANDVVQGVIFYLFLLIPFAYFTERLFFGYSDLKRQLGAAFGIFIVIFLIFSQIHPAFDIIESSPVIILIAFIMLALSVIVSLLVWGKFEEQLKAFNRTVSGVHKADVGKASIAFAAFALGISNMRRRKERTLLTCITLVLLTFTVLSFTSIVPTLRKNDVLAPGTPAYQGILLRTPTWDALQDPAYRLLNDEYGRKYAVAPRAWFYGTNQGQQTFLKVSRADLSSDVKGVEGFSPEEADVTGANSAIMTGPDGKPLGRWFNKSDTYSMLLPKGIADSLNISLSDLKRGVSVMFSGVSYQVIGIIDPDKMKAIKDLDNESITPVDFIAQASQGQTSETQSAASQGFQEYLHLDPNNVIYVPYRTLINMGGDLRSVAINFGDPTTVRNQLFDPKTGTGLMPRLDLNLYAGIGKQNHRFSAISGTSSKGLVNVIIPIIIASLIVLNTMLGSVYERVKEIAIFSSIGLSPSNIAMLFIAESLVYAIIGAVAGYLIGQGLSKIISVFHILPGLYLNFSSTSAEVSIGLVIAVVLLSTLFPARKASEVATPAVDRTWKLPEPDGDLWKITLPFAVSGAQAPGINGFLAEWFRSYEEQSVGDFLTQGVRSGVQVMPQGNGYRLSGRVWLAPFDLGVSQEIQLDTVPTDLEDVYAVFINLTRLSGDVSNWKRVNRRFLNVVRKQFLIWRTLSAEERERYMSAPEISLPIDNNEPAATPPAEDSAVAPAL